MRWWILFSFFAVIGLVITFIIAFRKHNKKTIDGNDGFDQARLKAAEECIKRGKIITGTMYKDGTLEIDGD